MRPPGRGADKGRLAHLSGRRFVIHSTCARFSHSSGCSRWPMPPSVTVAARSRERGRDRTPGGLPAAVVAGLTGVGPGTLARSVMQVVWKWLKKTFL